jgi:hypothetical protein
MGTASSTQEKLRKAERQQRLIVGLTWGFSIASFVATLAFLNWADRGARADREPPGVFSTNFDATPASAEARPVFRHSIVQGGVRSREEVVAAMAKDVVVKAHYSAVKPAALRAVKLSAPLNVHVSYRIGNNVYWTKRPLTVAAGEFVLTDGTVTIRERCGNLIAMAPLGPTQAGEPDPAEFEMHVQPLAPSIQSVANGSPRSGVGSIPDVAVATQFRLAPSATEFGAHGGAFGGGPPAGSKGSSSSGPGTPTTNSVDDPPPSNPPAGDPPAGNPPAGDPPAGNPPGGNPPIGDPGPPGSDPPTIKIQDGPGDPGDPGDPKNHLQDVPLPVPEPATWTLVGIGLAAAGVRRYLKKPGARS